ncbi:hypothetical protein [Paraburkholderia strydomiana]|uniref:hypothetical protein n=1 Tax=Paraburkholderia strydomiana TaxID=1245417 RepID=UPI001BE8E440|nr:hypothetical protein [Paraburkholderia strydomiana]MBT2789179.1 hypothetical protein [Paraburkholderia strydomiana]
MIEAPDAQIDTLRAGFFLGAKTFLDAACKSAKLDEERGRALLDECRGDIETFQAEAMREALSMFERMK